MTFGHLEIIIGKENGQSEEKYMGKVDENKQQKEDALLEARIICLCQKEFPRRRYMILFRMQELPKVRFIFILRTSLKFETD